MNTELAGKAAVVTGGSSGIGRAVALALAKEGARVALGARRVAECEETVRMIEAAGGEACAVQTDVRDGAQIRALVDAAVERWGRLDVAVNNAGIEGPNFIPIPDYSEQAWDEVIGINLKGVFLSMKYEIPHLLKTGGGAIVNVSSVAGLIGGKVGVAYYASKHGVIGATKAAAMEYAASGIRVNAVCPAVIQTPMAERLFVGREHLINDLHPMGRSGVPEEVADAIVWLCSARSSFVTGQAVPIDGGFLAR